MSALYRTEAVNRDGGTGVSQVVDGLEVRVSNPLAADFDPAASNPEQLLALAWATCLNATAQAIVRGEQRTAVRVEVELHRADPSRGGRNAYEFRVDAFLSAEGSDAAATERLVEASHARCPVSRLLADAATVAVHGEDYVAVS